MSKMAHLDRRSGSRATRARTEGLQEARACWISVRVPGVVSFGEEDEEEGREGEGQGVGSCRKATMLECVELLTCVLVSRYI